MAIGSCGGDYATEQSVYMADMMREIQQNAYSAPTQLTERVSHTQEVSLPDFMGMTIDTYV